MQFQSPIPLSCERRRRAFNPAAAIGALIVAVVAGPLAAQTAGPGHPSATTAFSALERQDYPAAIAAASDAVAREPANRGYRLALVDAYLGADRPGEALTALEPSRGDPSYEVQSRLGSALGRVDRHLDSATAFEAAASAAPDDASRAYAIRARTLSLVEGRDVARARSEYLSALAEGRLAGSDPMDLAVIAVAVGEDRTAQPLYAEAASSGRLSGRAALDAGYSARRAHNDPAAIDYFSQGIDDVSAGALALTPQTLFDVRRDVANLDRTWGANGSLSYGASGVASALPASAGSTDSLQAGLDVYRRLGGYRAGAPFEVFGRVFETLDASSGTTGSDSRQGWIGARSKPLTDANLVLEASRMVALGDNARDDWMVRASYSREQGTDMRVDRSAWPMWRVYADGSYIVDDQLGFGVIDARAGRSFAVDQNGRTVVSIFGAVSSNYDSSLPDAWAVGAGPGVSIRRWFRETPYAAPRSFIDFTLEYRVRLAGDERAEGVFATLSFNY